MVLILGLLEWAENINHVENQHLCQIAILITALSLHVIFLNKSVEYPLARE